MESIGLKEWSLVCDALGRGEQSVILRKGGIAEGRDGFSFRYNEFFLFPTFFHERIGKVRNRAQGLARMREKTAGQDPLILPLSPGEKGLDTVSAGDLSAASGEADVEAFVPNAATCDEEIVISLYAKVERALRIDSLQIAEALGPLHILAPELVKERFEYKAGGLNAAFVRVFRLKQPWIIPNEPRFGGCRSWVELPKLAEMAMQPVLDDAVHAERLERFKTVISATAL